MDKVIKSAIKAAVFLALLMISATSVMAQKAEEKKFRTASDLSSTCITCPLIGTYTGLVNQYIQRLSEVLIKPAAVLFAALTGLWIVIQGFKIAMGFLRPPDFLKELVFVIIASILISVQGPALVNTIYTASLAIMGGAAETAFLYDKGPDLPGGEVPPEFVGRAALLSLVFKVEVIVRQVFTFAGYIVGKSKGLIEPLLAIMIALILIVPYFLIVVVYFSQVVIAVFRLLVVAAFSPFLFLGLAFGWGREMMKAGIKTIISSIATLFACTVAVGIVAFGVTSLDFLSPAGADTALLKTMANKMEISFSNPDFLLMILMGWLGTAFMAEATHISNSLTGTILSNVGTGILTAGATGTAVAAGRATREHIRSGGKALADRVRAMRGGQ